MDKNQANQLEQGQSDASTSIWTFSECQGKDATATHKYADYPPPQIPFGLNRRWGTNNSDTDKEQCCGNCSVDASEVRLYYFKEANVTYDCQAMGRNALGPNVTTRTSKQSRSQKSRSLARRVVSVAPSGSIAIVSGNTLTSPCFYLEFVGTLGVGDGCGKIGSTVNNPFVAVPPGALTTWEGSVTTVGHEIDPAFMFAFGWLGAAGTFSPLKIIDVECPTWGVGTSIKMTKKGLSNFSTTVTTIGPPWLPLIVPPLHVMTLDPLWETLCSGIITKWNDHFAIFDPPRSLTPAQYMVPAPEPSPIDPPRPDSGTTTAAQPGKTPIADQPLQTGVPGALVDIPLGTAADPNNDVQNADRAKGTSADDPKNAVTSNAQGPDPESPNQPIKPGDHPHSTNRASKDDHTGPGQAPSPANVIQSNIGEAIMQALKPNSPPDSKPPAANDGAQSVPKAGQSADDAITPANDGAQNISKAGKSANEAIINPALTIGGQTFTPDPRGFAIGGTQLSPNGPAATIAGTKASLATSGMLHIGDQTFNVLPTLTANPPPITIGELTLTPNPTGFPISSLHLSPGGPPITISGTVISLANPDILFINDNPTTLNTAPRTTPLLLQAGSQFFTAHPHGFDIAGTSITPGGPAAIVSGTSISLSPSGTLTMGALTLDLNSIAATATEFSAFSAGTQPFMPNPTGFIIDGKTVGPGASGVVVDGTSVSLETGGVLHVGGEAVTPTTVDGAGVGSAPTASTGIGESGESISGDNATGLGNAQASMGVAALSPCCWQRILWPLAMAMTVRFQLY